MTFTVNVATGPVEVNGFTVTLTPDGVGRSGMRDKGENREVIAEARAVGR